MMKKYNKPEIVTLALDVIDVIETSAQDAVANELTAAGVENVIVVNKQIQDMNDTWSW